MASSFECVPGEVARSLPDAAGRAGSVSPPEAPVPGQRFPRTCRLTSRRQFKTVYAEGRRASCRIFTVFGLPNSLDRCRLGLTVTRKVGCAVVRNRIKRVLRDVFRRNRQRLEFPMDLVINGRTALLELPALQIERELLQCYERLSRRRRR